MVRIYLDNNATTAPISAVWEAVTLSLKERWGNPSSAYKEGREAKEALDWARQCVAALIDADPGEIVFTGGGSESDNAAIQGVVDCCGPGKVITSEVEHPAVLRTCRYLEKQGTEVVYVGVDSVGRVDPDEVRYHVDEDTLLISIMAAQNEVGTIQPIYDLALVAREHGIPFHTDAVQLAGKLPVSVRDLDIDLMSISAHKFHGPKGIGVLYVRRGAPVWPLIHGGKQERGMRAGTENTAGAAGMRAAALEAARHLHLAPEIAALRDRLEGYLVRNFPGARVNGDVLNRLPNTSNVTFPGVPADQLVLGLDDRGVSASAASACKVGTKQPSHVLLAMGLSEADALSSARFSLSFQNTEDEIDRAGRIIVETARSLS